MAEENPTRAIWPEYPRTGWGLYFDPLYGYIPLPPLIRQALDLETFQRLRRIKQLSTIELVYPGATHNRFEHSVGVYHLATTTFDALVNRRESEGLPDWPELHETHKIALQLAALFHDLGHGPHSHVFELYCNRNPDFRKWHHETVTRQLIVDGKGRYVDIPRFLHRVHETYRKDGMPGHEFLTPENVAAIALGVPPPADSRYLFLSQIVHSECDVDRMDYLRRDALHVGFAAGGVDAWEIIHNLTLVWDGDTGNWNLRVLSSAAEAFESLLAVRDLMYRRVYYTSAHRCAQEMIIRALHEISSKADREDLCLGTDEDLFQAFSSDELGTTFTKEVVASIRARRLYHSIPVRITANSDLDVEGQRIWSEYATGLPDKFESLLQIEDALGKRIALSLKYRIIFDVAPMPVSKPEAFSEKYFYDPGTQEVKSLRELLPHIEFTHRKVPIGHQAVDQYEEYRREVSRLYIFLPFEFLRECVDGIQRRLPQSHKDLFERTVARRDYSLARQGEEAKMRAIAEAFARELFNLHAPYDGKLISTITKAAMDYVDLIFKECYPEVSVVPP